MATVFPPWACDPACLPADRRIGIVREHQTLQRLRTALPSGHTVFHSTHLAWTQGARLRKREADFLIVNRAGQILMVEMKTGPLEETAAGLVKAYDEGRKGVITQLHEVTDALRQRFREAYGAQARLDIAFALYCPDHQVRDLAAAGLARGQLVDARDRHALPQAIRRLLPEGTPDPAQAERVHRMLAQELPLDPDRGALAEQGEHLVTRLTGDMLDFLSALEMSPFRLRVDGAAGCGKTQMVSFFAERARSVPPQFLFDALVVDEGQDIDKDGYELLKLLLHPGADVVWLEDENQNLNGGPLLSEPGFVRYRCRDNHRSPRRIARFITTLLPFSFEARNPLPGDMVQVIEAQPAALLDRLAERVERLVAGGYALEQIVVLTGRGLHSSVAMKAGRIAGHATRRLAGYGAEGRAQFTEGTLRVETLRRFKGQQAPAVVVCELDGELTDPEFQRRLYVVATRATQRLEFLLPRASALLGPMRRAAAV